VITFLWAEGVKPADIGESWRIMVVLTVSVRGTFMNG